MTVLFLSFSVLSLFPRICVFSQSTFLCSCWCGVSLCSSHYLPRSRPSVLVCLVICLLFCFFLLVSLSPLESVSSRKAELSSARVGVETAFAALQAKRAEIDASFARQRAALQRNTAPIVYKQVRERMLNDILFFFRLLVSSSLTCFIVGARTREKPIDIAYLFCEPPHRSAYQLCCSLSVSGLSSCSF